jgi:hypothetical protein
MSRSGNTARKPNVNTAVSVAENLSPWSLAAVLSLVQMPAVHLLPRWASMWLIATLLYIAAKWLTLCRRPPRKLACRRGRLLSYALLWPGMDPQSFCTPGSPTAPATREWANAITKTFFGVALIWTVAPLTSASRPLLAGWIAMIGLVFLLHFGAFNLLALFWRAQGIDARSIMRFPLGATSLSDFWRRRWNVAFSDLMNRHAFRPLTRRFGPRAAMFIVFLILGLLHECVISFPAGGGYGRPTCYFLIQALGLGFERSFWGRNWGLGTGWKGWCYVVLVVGAPVYWLFHPIFVRNVILPMLHAIGAT